MRAGFQCCRSSDLHKCEIRGEIRFCNLLLQDKLSKAQSNLFILWKRRIRYVITISNFQSCKSSRGLYGKGHDLQAGARRSKLEDDFPGFPVTGPLNCLISDGFSISADYLSEINDVVQLKVVGLMQRWTSLACVMQELGYQCICCPLNHFYGWPKYYLKSIGGKIIIFIVVV